jgi:hypothetical protein
MLLANSPISPSFAFVKTFPLLLTWKILMLKMDSNPYILQYCRLKTTCLPISPPEQIGANK